MYISERKQFYQLPLMQHKLKNTTLFVCGREISVIFLSYVECNMTKRILDAGNLIHNQLFTTL